SCSLSDSSRCRVRTAPSCVPSPSRRHMSVVVFFFLTDTATTGIYTLSLHDALPIFALASVFEHGFRPRNLIAHPHRTVVLRDVRSEEHTSELQSREKLVCRLLLEKKKIGRNYRLRIGVGADELVYQPPPNIAFRDEM